MKGITPVIAIILLLLMAVAAAGGFYFVYQQFSQSGEESGSSQIDTLGEQALSQIKIESAAGGRLYIRNTGATDIDASKLSVFVENVPVEVNSSSDTLAENSRATLKLTQVPACTSEKCEVKISGPASTSRSIDISALVCSTDADCLSGETCSSGICTRGEGEGDCGNGVCDSGEHSWSCWQDCHPDSLLLYPKEAFGGDGYLIDTRWNGTTYAFSENLTNNIAYSWGEPSRMAFSSDGTGGAVGTVQADSDDDIWYSRYDGSEWSYPYNVTNNGSLYTQLSIRPLDFDGTGNGLVVWNGRYPSLGNSWLGWSEIVNGVPSEAQQMPDTNVKSPSSFAYTPDGNGYALMLNDTFQYNNFDVKQIFWNGNSWGTPQQIANYENLKVNSPAISFGSDGNGFAFWDVYNETFNEHWIHHASYDGSAWTYEGNFYKIPDNSTSLGPLALFHDHESDPLLFAYFSSGDMPYISHFFHDNGAWSGPRNFTGDPFSYAFPHRYGNTVFTTLLDLEEAILMGRVEWQWTYWNGNSWSDFVYANSRSTGYS